MNNINWLEWIGYLASILILISLLMSSIVKLRWINLIGSLVFAIYGFLIGALPVGIVNSCIVIINIYYLVKMYTCKEYFNLLPIEPRSEYLKYFLGFYKEDIETIFRSLPENLEENTVSFYMLRNTVPAGVFLASHYDDQSILINLDFVRPEYRDFKLGQYIYENQQKHFLSLGYDKLYSYAFSEKHKQYLEKMGFVPTMEKGQEIYVKTLGN